MTDPDIAAIVEREAIAPRIMRMEWSTDEGQVVFSFPSNLNAADVEDVEKLLQVTLIGMRRRASTPRDHIIRSERDA